MNEWINENKRKKERQKKLSLADWSTLIKSRHVWVHLLNFPFLRAFVITCNLTHLEHRLAAIMLQAQDCTVSLLQSTNDVSFTPLLPTGFSFDLLFVLAQFSSSCTYSTSLTGCFCTPTSANVCSVAGCCGQRKSGCRWIQDTPRSQGGWLASRTGNQQNQVHGSSGTKALQKHLDRDGIVDSVSLFKQKGSMQRSEEMLMI